MRKEDLDRALGQTPQSFTEAMDRTLHGLKEEKDVKRVAFRTVILVAVIILLLCATAFALMGQGRLKLSYLPHSAQLVSGDEVLTSGKGDVFPSGLVVGTVEAVFTDPSGMNRYAVVEPDVDLDSLVEVFVIKSFDIVE